MGVAGNSCREDEALLRQVRCAQREFAAALVKHRRQRQAPSSTEAQACDDLWGGGGGGSDVATKPPMLICDCRPKANAVVCPPPPPLRRCRVVCSRRADLTCRLSTSPQANKAAGMGYTSYRDSTLVFLHIHNIHAVRERCVGAMGGARGPRLATNAAFVCVCLLNRTLPTRVPHAACAS